MGKEWNRLHRDERKKLKQQYCERIHREAPEVGCACGCGEIIKSMDLYGRPKRYVSGHNNRKYENPTQYKREWNHRHRSERCRAKTEYSRKRKVKLILLAGGGCMQCGMKYNGQNGAAFDFHHRDPSVKIFCVSAVNLVNHAWKSIAEEAGKCDLLCSCCHRVEHFGGW